MAGQPQQFARKQAADAAAQLRAAEAETGVRLDRNGKPLVGAAGKKMTDEVRERLRQARIEGAQRRAEEKQLLQLTSRQARDDAIERLWPKAFKVWQMAMDNAIERGTVDTNALKAAMALFEQKFGKPTQKVEQKTDTVTRVVYEAAAYSFDPN